MLPKTLTEDVCSMNEGVERLSFSVLWELDPNTADIQSTRFAKTVVRSRAALSYSEAQSRIDDERWRDPTTESLRRLNALSKKLRHKRSERGALTLASPEARFELDSETLDPTDVANYQPKDTNRMIEEFMLLANISVAKFIYETFPSCALLRRHAPPSPTMFEPLVKASRAAGEAFFFFLGWTGFAFSPFRCFCPVIILPL